MRTPWLHALLFLATAATPVLIYLAVQTSKTTSAATELAELSDAGEELTYFARFRGATDGSSNKEGTFVTYHAPGSGFRWDFGEPIALDDDESDMEEILKGGDILIINLSHQGNSVSCRTERGSCRSLDGLEILALSSFFTLFTYPGEGIYEQPHTVETLDGSGTFDEEARCFVIREKDPDAIKTQPAGFGFVIGEGLPVTLCYAADGLPLFFSQEGDSTSSPGIKAVDVSRQVDRSVFNLPFTFVPSIYDEEE